MVVTIKNSLAKGFVRCKLSDPALNECIKIGLQSAYPQLSKGIQNSKTIF